MPLLRFEYQQIYSKWNLETKCFNFYSNMSKLMEQVDRVGRKVYIPTHISALSIKVFPVLQFFLEGLYHYLVKFPWYQHEHWVFNKHTLILVVINQSSSLTHPNSKPSVKVR